jgi:hypothetical protein
MGVTTIGIEDTIGGAVGRFGEVLGDALDKTIFAEGLKEKELRGTPAVMQSLVPSVRAAQRGGLDTMTAQAKGLGVSVEFLDEILSFSPTRAQAVDEAFLIGGGAEKVAASAISQALFAGDTAQAALDAGLPAIQAAALASQGEFDALNYEVQYDVLGFQVTNGVIETQLKTEKIQAELGLETAQATQSFFNGFDQTTEEGRRNAMKFAFALNNPAYLNHLGLHEQMNFQASLELMRAARGTELSEADKIGLSLDLQGAWNTAVDRLQEADDEGTDELLEIAASDLNSVRLMIEEANQSGLIFTIDTSVATLGKKFFGGAKLELAATMFDDPRVAAFVVEMTNLKDQDGNPVGITDVAQLSTIDIEGNPLIDREGKPTGKQSILDSLPPRLREQVVRDFPNFIKQLETLEVSDVGMFKAGGTFEETTRVPQQTGIEALKFLYTGLSEVLKTVLDASSRPLVTEELGR